MFSCPVLKMVDWLLNIEAKVKIHKNPQKFLWIFCARPSVSIFVGGAFHGVLGSGCFHEASHCYSSRWIVLLVVGVVFDL